jgi:hypothetical protein
MLAVAAVAITFTSNALGDKYSDIVAKGYRWAIADGLYACVSKDDVRRMVNNPDGEVKLKMVEEVKAYFLIPGKFQTATGKPESGNYLLYWMASQALWRVDPNGGKRLGRYDGLRLESAEHQP